jgi:hypothetical protein
LLALHELTYLTKVKSYIVQQEQACNRHQGRLSSRIYRKRSAKKKKTEKDKFLPAWCHHLAQIQTGSRLRCKKSQNKSFVTTMMQQVRNQYQTNVATKTAEAKTMNAKKKRKAKPKKAKENDIRRPAETIYKIHQIHQRLQRRRPSVCVVADMGI